MANVTLMEVAVQTLYSHVPKRTIIHEKDGKCAIGTSGKLNCEYLYEDFVVFKYIMIIIIGLASHNVLFPSECRQLVRNYNEKIINCSLSFLC